MQVVLHIGTHKTGTTSIQDALRSSSKALRQAGILFPEAGSPSRLSGQHMLAWSVVSSKQHKLPSPQPPVWEQLWREVDTIRPRKVVLSAEAFSKASKTEVEAMKDKLDGHEVSVVLYLRNPVDYLKSTYKQQVKMGKCTKPLSQFVKNWEGGVDCESLVRRWIKVFGAPNVQIRRFEKAVEHGLLCDFAQVTGIDPALLVKESRSNVSPPDEIIHIVRYLNLVEQRMGSVFQKSEKRRSLIERIRRRLLRGGPVVNILRGVAKKLGLEPLKMPDVT